MRTVYFGIGIAGLLLTLFWFGMGSQHAAVQAQSQPVNLSQIDSLVLTTTIGSEPSRCGDTQTVRARAGTRVYPCYRIHHTGDVTDTGAVTYTLHRISTMRQGIITRALPLALGPGVITDTIALGLAISDVADVDVTDTITWEARTLTPTQYVTLTGMTFVDVVTSAVLLEKTVGQDPTSCPSTQFLRVPTGEDVNYCITLVNRGDITFTHHRLVDQPLGIDVTLAYSLPPGERWQVTQAVLDDLGVEADLGRSNVSDALTNTAALTASTAGGLTATAVATAAVDTGVTTVIFTKTVGTEPLGCSTTTNLTLPPGAQLYYCASILNTGEVTLTHHVLHETALEIDLAFDHLLPPGEQLTVTNEVLTTQFGQPALLGPFRFNHTYPTVVNNTMFYTGTSAEGESVNTNASTFADFPPTPVPTNTPRPRPTNTPVPVPTSTPPPTDTPLPPTFTPSPTPTPVTPSPTPTRSYAISELATPSPRTPAGGEGAGNIQGSNGEGVNSESPLTTPANAGAESPLATPALTSTASAAGSEADGRAIPPTAATTTPLPQPSQEVVVVVVTNTPLPSEGQGESEMDDGSSAAIPDPAILDPQRPIAYPTPTATPDYLLLTAQSLDAALAAATWLWILGGALLFFISAGAVVGLFVWRRPPGRYALQPEVDPDYVPMSPEPRADRWTRGAASAQREQFYTTDRSSFGPSSFGPSSAGPSATDQQDEEDDWPDDLP